MSSVLELEARRGPSRSRARGRARASRQPQRCYRNADRSGLDDRPAFDTTPFDSSTGVSAWDALPTESIFSEPSTSARSPTDWLSSPEPDERGSYRSSPPDMASTSRISPSSRGATASGYRSTASPLLKKVFTKSNTSRGNSTRASGLDSSGRLPGSSPFPEDSASRPYSLAPLTFDDDDDDYAVLFASSTSSCQAPLKVDTSPLPPWKPYWASERLEDPNNPPPMFHPMFNNEWRYDPNISDDLRNLYASSCSEYSPHHCIYEYGRLSEYNTQNVYDPEKFAGINDQGFPNPARVDDGTEVFGDPREALARSTADVPDKFRKEKWHYFELKQRLELFKKLGMETDLAMYEGQLERMEANPWDGDTSGREIQVYVRGMENDPAYDDDLLAEMEELVAPSNEGRKAFYAAMANPPPIRDECLDDSVASGTKDADNSAWDDSFHTCFEGEDSLVGVSENSALNTSFTLPDGARASFPDGIGPDDC